MEIKVNKIQVCADIDQMLNEVLVEHYKPNDWTEDPDADNLVAQINLALSHYLHDSEES